MALNTKARKGTKKVMISFLIFVIVFLEAFLNQKIQDLQLSKSFQFICIVMVGKKIINVFYASPSVTYRAQYFKSSDNEI